VADWRDELIAQLRAELAVTRAELTAARAEIAALKEQLGASSNNSSRPPSSDAPSARAQRKKKPPTGRKPGGQPGHERNIRPLVPLEKVAKVVTCKPERCAKCSRRLTGTDPDPHRHQVFELPKVEPIVYEYQQHALQCPCGHVTRGALPPGVPTGAFGPTVVAAVALLLTVYRLSRRVVPEFLRDFFGLTMAPGSVVKCQQAASSAIAKPVQEAHAYAKAAGVKYADETGWREARGRAFIWTVVTSAVTVFIIQARRTADAAKKALGAVHGVLGTDRHGAYNFWPDVRRQFCWSHLSRAFIVMSERGGPSKIVGDGLTAEKDQMFIWWHRVRDGTMARSTFKRYMRPVQDRVYAILQSGAQTCACTKTGRTCQKLLDHFNAMWTFVYNEGVEPTNNGSERAIRHAVILRKLCFGSHSSAGSRFTERMLTCHATLRQQGRNILAFLTEACQATLFDLQPPSLLPSKASAPRPLAKAA
jgi:transposase